ncbi:MAG: ACT domain-containing protein [Myxococcota bacterium]
MKLTTQLSIFLRNKPGVLASICEGLGKAKINIHGMSVADAIDHAVLRLVLDKPRAAAHLLGEAGMLAIESDVIQLSLPNKPGTLAKMARKLARAKVNIDYAYAAGAAGVTRSTVFLKVSDTKKAMRALKRK